MSWTCPECGSPANEDLRCDCGYETILPEHVASFEQPKVTRRNIILTAVPLAFRIGFIAHSVVWLLIINFDDTWLDMACADSGCILLILIDFPVSALFVKGNFITTASFILGGAWWGGLLSVFIGGIRFVHRMTQ